MFLLVANCRYIEVFWGGGAGVVVTSMSMLFLPFLLFRLFDILKPPPVGWLDRKLKGGLGVMADDVAAAGLTLLVLAVFIRLGVLV